MGDWGLVSRDEAFARAAGRNALLARRRDAMRERRRRLFDIVAANVSVFFCASGRSRPGARAELAARLGCSPRTLVRDLQAIRADCFEAFADRVQRQRQKEVERDARQRLKRAHQKASVKLAIIVKN
jgi:AraC-like DNA-binding protein